MKISKINAVYFSATGNTKKIVDKIADELAAKWVIPLETFDFTCPARRERQYQFRSDELIIFGLPVYAGRIPNKILPLVQNLFDGGGALAVPIVTFGNRSYDNALIELRNELEEYGFHTIAAGAFTAEHAFSPKLAAGRPDEKDMQEISAFAGKIAEKVCDIEEIPERIPVKGKEPIPAYYRPLGVDGKPAVFLKAKPKTSDACNYCKMCAEVCPMGSIDIENPRVVSGICIKCQACIKICPSKAKYFDDEAFLSHVNMLEQNYTRRAENETFV